jgi:hypothetical protein
MEDTIPTVRIPYTDIAVGKLPLAGWMLSLYSMPSSTLIENEGKQSFRVEHSKFLGMFLTDPSGELAYAYQAGSDASIYRELFEVLGALVEYRTVDSAEEAPDVPGPHITLRPLNRLTVRIYEATYRFHGSGSFSDISVQGTASGTIQFGQELLDPNGERVLRWEKGELPSPSPLFLAAQLLGARVERISLNP